MQQGPDLLARRYEVVSALGSGAAGSLYLAKDRRRDGAVVALKILRPRVRDPSLEPLFRREFVLLSEVRHSNIVSVHDFGFLESGEPYFTMDFVAGDSARKFVQEDRLDAVAYLDLTAGLLRALARLHAAGILHRDLKPENVILTEMREGTHPVLVDFGLAMSAAAARPGEASGTVPYIAPEVVAGAAPDGRADLFALGMVLFELSTGGPIADFAEILNRPAQTLAPERVRRVLRQRARGTVPRRFEDFVCRLTAPTAEGRHASAVAALEALGELYGSYVDVDLEEFTRVPLFTELPLVGRGSALQELLQRIAALKEGRLLDPIVVVAGKAGSGVTRLLSATRNHAMAGGCAVASGESLFRLAGDAAAVLGTAPPQPSEKPRALVFRADHAAHAAPATAFPVFLLDDVHKFNESEVAALRDWIAALERKEDRASLLLVLGGRSDAPGSGAELLRTAGGTVPVDLRELAPLSTADVRAAFSVVLGGRGRIPTALVQGVHRASEGNPRLVSELVHLLVAERVLEFEGGEPVLHEERLRSLSLPASISEAATRRLDRLPEEKRACLARLALVPDSLAYAAARSLAGETIDGLIAAGLLVLDRGRVQFPDEIARKAADSLHGDERKSALMEGAALVEDADSAAATRLLLQANGSDAAVRVGLPAARMLREQHHLQDARRLLEDIRAECDSDEVARELTLVLQDLGLHADAARLGLPILERNPQDREFMFLVMSCLVFSGAPQRALELLAPFDRETSGEEAARVINAKAGTLAAMGRLEEALLESKRAEAAAGSLFALQGRIARLRANLLRRLGRRNGARKVEDLLIKGSPDEAPANVKQAAFVNRGVLDFRRGLFLSCIRDLRAAARIADAHEWHDRSLNVFYNLATVLAALGRYGRALRCYEKSKRYAELTAMEESVGTALAGEAECLVELGRPAEGETRLHRLESLPSHVNVPRLRTASEEIRCRLLFLGGRIPEARSYLRGLSEEADSQGEEAVLVAIQLAACHAAEGENQAAESALREAVAVLLRTRRRRYAADLRVGLAEAAAGHGAWNLAERWVERGRVEKLALKTPLRAKALLVSGGAALQRGEVGAAGRLLEEAVFVANRSDSAPVRAEVYAAVAALLQEVEFQRFLRRPTGGGAAALLQVAREIWALYGNEIMVRRIDLSLSELPRPSGDPLGGADADQLVKILHIAREMNREFDRDRLLGLILDRAIELTQAERGFVILLKEGKEAVHLARNLDREAISEPERKVSSHIIKEVIRTGRIVTSDDAVMDQRFQEFLSVSQLRLRAVIAVPFRSNGKTVGALYLDNRFKPGNFGERDERILELFADQAVAAIDKAELIHELESKSHELEDHYRRQKQELKSQGRRLKSAQKELRAHRKARGWSFDRIVARSPTMQAVIREAKRIARSDIPVLISGENGTGKEMLARALHFESLRQSMPFVAVNCAAFPEGLLEAELFGHVRGSFTGADRDRAGLFEEADGGTLFLDEVGDMAPTMQVRLLRTLELGEVKRIGENRVRTVDVRLLTATNADLEELMRKGRFREDLYYRISGIVLALPPLRDRLEDLEPLARDFIAEICRREGRPEVSLTGDAVAKLESYVWPGNVRELRNIVARAVVTAEKEVLSADDIIFDSREIQVLTSYDQNQIDEVLAEITSHGVDLNRRELSVLSRLLARGKISFGEYQHLFRISKSTVARDIRNLVALRLVERRGKTRSAVYTPGRKLREAAARVAQK